MPDGSHDNWYLLNLAKILQAFAIINVIVAEFCYELLGCLIPRLTDDFFLPFMRELRYEIYPKGPHLQRRLMKNRYVS